MIRAHYKPVSLSIRLCVEISRCLAQRFFCWNESRHLIDSPGLQLNVSGGVLRAQENSAQRTLHQSLRFLKCDL